MSESNRCGHKCESGKSCQAKVKEVGAKCHRHNGKDRSESNFCKGETAKEQPCQNLAMKDKDHGFCHGHWKKSMGEENKEDNPRCGEPTSKGDSACKNAVKEDGMKCHFHGGATKKNKSRSKNKNNKADNDDNEMLRNDKLSMKKQIIALLTVLGDVTEYDNNGYTYILDDYDKVIEYAKDYLTDKNKEEPEEPEENEHMEMSKAIKQ